MILEKHGTGILVSEVTSVGPHGFWLLNEATEYFVAFADYPQFKQATVEQIFRIQQVGPEQLSWPDVDVDIELDALRHPEKYPLSWQA